MEGRQILRFAEPLQQVTETPQWCAVFTLPRSEKCVAERFAQRDLESFLPLYKSIRTWKNRQRVRVSMPLFPGYVFVRMDRARQSAVLKTPGVIYVVGNRQRAEIADEEIQLLREGCSRSQFEPYQGLVVGERVRICNGALRGVEGVLVRKHDSLRFVITVKMINQSAAVEVMAEDIEPLR
jgi:transcription antitermination factor NusG